MLYYLSVDLRSMNEAFWYYVAMETSTALGNRMVCLCGDSTLRSLLGFLGYAALPFMSESAMLLN